MPKWIFLRNMLGNNQYFGSPPLPFCEHRGVGNPLILQTEIHVVSSQGRDSRDIRSSRLAEATQKPFGTNAL